MKRYSIPFLLSVVLFITSPAGLAGQTPCGEAYTRIIAEGDAFLKKGNYKDAFEKYRAARGCSEAEHQVLDKKTADVLRAVDGEREKADESAAMARRLQKKAEAALQKAEAAEKKANAVLNRIYFYQDRFGLAYENGQYGFIDKNLNTKIDFQYNEAMPFDYTGFAWVKRLDNNRKQIEFVIDTLGNEYPLAYDVTEMKETIVALDLRNRDLDSLPKDIFRYTQLKILMLAGNQLRVVPPEIEHLENLIFLGLSRNQLEKLPPELGNLPNLKTLQVFANKLTILPSELGNLQNLNSLDLSSNQLDQLPRQLRNLKNMRYLNLQDNLFFQAEQRQIREMMPNCKVLIQLTEKENIRLREEYNQQVQAGENRLQSGDTTVRKADLAYTYNNLAWYQLLTGQFSKAEGSVQRGLALDSANQYLLVNLPHALLLQDDPAKEYKSLSLYTEWKDKGFIRAGLPKFRDAFLSDFISFEAAGIIPPSRLAAIARVKKLLKE